jgi:toxin ParE1/3/4
LSLVRYEFSPAGLKQLAKILRESQTDFGPAARARYEALVFQAVEDLLDNPSRPGTQTVEGRIHYHLRHSRTRVPTGEGRVGRPRHILITRIVGETLRILAIGYDAMEDGLRTRIEEGEDG